MSLRRWQLTVALPCFAFAFPAFYLALGAEGTLRTVGQIAAAGYIVGVIILKRRLDRRFADPS